MGFRQRVDSGSRAPRPAQNQDLSQPEPIPYPSGLEATPPILPAGAEIRSAGAEVITSDGLRAFKETIRATFDERTSIEHELRTTVSEARSAKERYLWWDSGFLFKRLWPKRFVVIRQVSDELAAKQAELEEQLRLSHVPLEIDAPKEQIAAFARFSDDFVAMARSQRIWDTTSRHGINRIAERTTANEAITREPVSFALGQTDLIVSTWRVPHLGNRNGGDIYIFPAFALYRVSQEAFAVVALAELEFKVEPCNFIEREGVPPDSQVVSQTWHKANKDGSADRRFNGNYQIPVARYASLSITSASGLNEQYLISNFGAAEAAGRSWASLKATLSAVTA